MPSLALAAAQTVPRRGDVDANTDEHLRLARLAGEHGARVVVFPELSLTGYELDLAAGLAFTEDDVRLIPLREAARAVGATLVVGAPVRLGTRLHIGAFVLPPDGVPALYTKRRLGAFPPEVNPGGPVPPAEGTVFHPGERDPLVDLGSASAAIAVCADVGDPRHAAGAASRGVRAYLASMFVIPAELADEQAKLRGYAVRHALAVVMANFGGPSGGLPSGGASTIWAPGGEALVTLADQGAGLALAFAEPDGWRGQGLSIAPA